ncbi:hypothetical protein [Undibacterium crateris]|uniref:hypothetical protein n=1 Tax=Undibacterium crateris TaxID=2528175 RepID=UPI00138A421B|nr:hypothetical protein [Undibacterium crateris]NDI85065.1 hypothetical protein [Undibacterium crateris]
MGLFDNVSQKLQGAKGAVLSAGSSIAQAQLKKHLPAGAGGLIGAGARLLSGNVNGAIASAIGVGMGALRKKSSIGADIIDQMLYMQTPTPCFGGISPSEAKRIYDGYANTDFARKNLFLIEVTDVSPADDDSGMYMEEGGVTGTFNMFATEVSYSPWTLTGEKRKIGSTSVDSLSASEPMDMRITTLDDANGTLKKWFVGKCKQAVPSDGTVGLPADFLIKIRLVHSFITDESGGADGYVDTVYVRPGNIDMELSRRDSAMQELVLTFVQFDNYFPVT